MLSPERFKEITHALAAEYFDSHLFDKWFNEDNVDVVLFDFWTPLTLAIELHNLPAVRYFIELGADLNAPGPEKKTPLIQAVFLNDRTVVNLLIENGALVPLRDHMGYPLLSVAVNNQLIELTHKLVEELGADVNEVDEDDHTTPLINAARVGNLEVVNLLIRNHALINAVPLNGITAIAAAAIQGHSGIVLRLIHERADMQRAKKSIKSRLEEVFSIAGDDAEEEIGKLQSGFALLDEAVRADEKNELSHNRYSLFNDPNRSTPHADPVMHFRSKDKGS